ncbi:hypothetical protein D3C72_2197320 [compost metagenome]
MACLQHSFEVPWVVRFQRLRGSGQEKVIQAGDPEAQGGRSQHQGPDFPFGVGEGAHASVGRQPRLHQFGDEFAGIAFDAPVVDADRYVE